MFLVSSVKIYSWVPPRQYASREYMPEDFLRVKILCIKFSRNISVWVKTQILSRNTEIHHFEMTFSCWNINSVTSLGCICRMYFFQAFKGWGTDIVFSLWWKSEFVNHFFTILQATLNPPNHLHFNELLPLTHFCRNRRQGQPGV